MKIVLDVFGGDNSPLAHVEGAVNAIKLLNDIEVVLVGDENIINKELSKYSFDKNKIQVVNASDVITNDDSPMDVLKKKPDSSMVKALELTKNDESVAGMITTGSTGAALMGATFKLGRQKGVMRPCLAPLLPSENGGRAVLVDAGANIDCKKEFLVQFALMGSCYMKAVYGIENPRVALLNIGAEETKGNELVKETYQLLKVAPINFVGNIEAKNVLDGSCDVIVCDGFVGNVLLKSVEGVFAASLKMVKKAVMGSLKSKIGGMLIKKQVKKMVKNLMSEGNAAAFLGCNKLICKAHGNANSENITLAFVQLYKMAQGDLTNKIAAEMEKITNNEV